MNCKKAEFISYEFEKVDQILCIESLKLNMSLLCLEAKGEENW